MKQKIALAVALVVAALLAGAAAVAQNAPTPSLEEQLEAQYKLVKVAPEANAANVLEPGTVLVIQKDGIFGVPYASAAVCPSRYQDGKVDSPDALCPAPVKKNSRSFKVGEKAYPSKIAVDLKKSKISFDIIACDACNGTNPPSSVKSEVIFQFPKGYLETASVPEVEDTIGEVLAVDNSSVAQAPQPTPSEPGEAGPTLLTNDMVIKMAGAKLGDAVILAKIKASQCNFDTSTDALIKLKQAGVGDAVLQAMVEGGGQPMAEPPAQPAAPPAETSSAPPCTDYASCLASGSAAIPASQWDRSLADLQKASNLEPTKPEAWEGIGYVYLAIGQHQNAVAMWDKALGLGGTLTFGIWHYAGLHGYEMGTFHLGAKEVSFVLADGKRVFSVAPTEVSSVKSHHPPLVRSAWSFGMKVGGHYYWFSCVPLGVQCENPIRCNDPAGYNQEGAVSNYVAQTIGKLAPGSLGK